MTVATIERASFLAALRDLLDEVFEHHHGIFLDPGTSLFPTLAGISAAQASLPVGGRCATLAAQVAHLTFYLEVLERYIGEHDSSPADWGAAWRTVAAVDDAGWDALRDGLALAYRGVSALIGPERAWDEDEIGGAMAIVVHSAYHLGEIRQALCVLRA